MRHTAISATVITFNEEAHIEACLDSLRDIADEIIVVDSYSSDRTAEICERRGCKVTRRKLSGYGAQRQYATSLTSHSYVLSLDADEVLSPALRQSLLQLKKEGFAHRVYSFSRLNFFCGQPVRHSGWYPDLQIRLFDKRYANWNLRDVAEEVIFRDSVIPRRVDGDILHYRCDTRQEYVNTERRHAAILSRVIAARNPSITPLTPYIKGLQALLASYFKQRGCLDGREGRQISLQSFNSTMLAYTLAHRIIKKRRKSSSSSNDENS